MNEINAPPSRASRRSVKAVPVLNSTGASQCALVREHQVLGGVRLLVP